MPLPASTAARLARQCSRTGYDAVTGWTPAEADLARLAADLRRLPTPPNARPGFTPLGSTIQVVGMTLADGRRRLYLNAFAREAGPCAGTPTQPCTVCDGGPTFWGALYDPAAGTFEDVASNGGFGG